MSLDGRGRHKTRSVVHKGIRATRNWEYLYKHIEKRAAAEARVREVFDRVVNSRWRMWLKSWKQTWKGEERVGVTVVGVGVGHWG